MRLCSYGVEFFLDTSSWRSTGRWAWASSEETNMRPGGGPGPGRTGMKHGDLPREDVQPRRDAEDISPVLIRLMGGKS